MSMLGRGTRDAPFESWTGPGAAAPRRGRAAGCHALATTATTWSSDIGGPAEWRRDRRRRRRVGGEKGPFDPGHRGRRLPRICPPHLGEEKGGLGPGPRGG